MRGTGAPDPARLALLGTCALTVSGGSLRADAATGAAHDDCLRFLLTLGGLASPMTAGSLLQATAALAAAGGPSDAKAVAAAAGKVAVAGPPSNLMSSGVQFTKWGLSSGS